eukprot:g7029.t1
MHTETIPVPVARWLVVALALAGALCPYPVPVPSSGAVFVVNSGVDGSMYELPFLPDANAAARRRLAGSFPYTAQQSSASLRAIRLGPLQAVLTKPLRAGCPGTPQLLLVGLGGWDTSAVVDASRAFKGNTGPLAEVAFWNVSALEYAAEMFSGAQSFDADLSGWRPRRLDVFFWCYNPSGPCFAEVGLNHSSLKDKDEALRRVLSCGMYMNDLLSKYLDMAKAEAASLQTERVAFSPHKVIGGAFELMEVIATQKGLLLEVSFEHTVPPTMVNDPTRFQQILLNLISNAIKFTETGSVRGEVSVRGGRLQVLVRDTGIGITPE